MFYKDYFIIHKETTRTRMPTKKISDASKPGKTEQEQKAGDYLWNLGLNRWQAL